MENKNVNKSWDEVSQSPWLTYTQYGAIKQIYFEDIRSITEKIKFAKNKKLGGIAIWALGYDGGDMDLWNTIEKENIE